MEPKISIIVPIYQSEKWLDHCIQSLINQTYKNLEILLINDGSTDKSKIICEKYRALDKRIILINQDNKGVSYARNKGIEIATGEYIQFVDSDDYIELNMCELLLETIIEKNADLVVCGLNIYENNKLLRTPKLEEKLINLKEDFNYYWWLRKINLGPCNKLYKKALIKNKFDYKKSLGEDTLFVWNYMINIEKVSVISNNLYNVRLDNNSSLNRKYREDKLELVFDLRKEEEKFCSKMYQENYNKTLIYNEYVLALHSCLRDIVEIKSLKESLVLINKYLKLANKTIYKQLKESNFDRIDYKVFKNLVKINNKYLIYIFFRIKLLIN